MKNAEILNELIDNQLLNVERDRKLNYSELKRLSKYIDTPIFDETRCCIWNGYVTNIKNPSKGVYINFYFRGKKPVLHRLLYINFVGKLSDDEYLKFTCENKGKCCNIKHLQKFHYVINDLNEGKKSNDLRGKKKKTKSSKDIKLCDKKPISLTVNFN